MKVLLDEIYDEYNRREFVHPDPLEFLYDYKKSGDREIVGLVAASLAYGRVAQILKSVSAVIKRMDEKPLDFVSHSSERDIKKAFLGFKHRFTTGVHMASLLAGVKSAVAEYGSLKSCFLAGYDDADDTVLPALNSFVRRLACVKGLLPSPDMGSACKRLNLFLRWMVRKDAVDPGGWRGIPPPKLVIPLDTHMYKVGRALGFTKRNAVDMRTALEITRGFAAISPDDPVRYDFSLTRFGIRNDADMDDLILRLRGKKRRL